MKKFIMVALTALASQVSGQMEIIGENQDQQVDGRDGTPTIQGEFTKTIQQMIVEAGFISETREANPDDADNHKLVVHRIRPQEANRNDENPVFMMHGMEGSSMDWVMNGPSLAPAFKLAAAGYDVWLGNNRGNFYSYLSTNQTYSQESYWQFGVEEIGLVDIKAMIILVLDVTNKEKVTYVGIQQGSQVLLIGASLDPLFFNNKVDLHVALAPRSEVNSYGQVVGFIYFFWAFWTRMLQQFGWYDLLKRDQYFEEAQRCTQNLQECKVNNGDGAMNPARMPFYQAHKQAGVSWMTIDHFAQNIYYQKFQQYEYGQADVNQLVYGQLTPPLYPLNLIEIPTAVIYTPAYENPDIEQFLLDPVRSNFNAVVQKTKVDIEPVQALYMGAEMGWFDTFVIDTIRNKPTLNVVS